MHSTPKLPLTEVEEEEDKVEEEEADGLDLQKTELVTIMNTQSIQNTLTTLKVRGEEARDGPISPMFSVNTARSMATMNKNAELSMLIRTVTRIVGEPMSLKNRKSCYRWCLCLIKQLKNTAAQIYGYQIMVASIT